MDLYHEDTIAAIATPPGEGSVAIVRISGPSAYPIADRVFACTGRKPSARPEQTFAHGRIVVDGEELDEVLVLFMRAPRSYTCEDVIEIQGHGGRQSARRILRAVLEAGARLAEPGEFTRRAFLNGRIDLVQAEAVLDLIRSRSDRAAAAAVEQLEGVLSASFGQLYDHVLALAADLEATLDFPEDELPVLVMDPLISSLIDARRRVGDLLATWDEGHLLRDGALVVISGKPNVGKSTLLNALLGKDRAIVSDTPGTTRDSIEEGFLLGGIPVRLVDTAGLRDTDCMIEQEGIRRTRALVASADLHLYLADASEALGSDERDQIGALDVRRSIVLLNKIDLGRVAVLGEPAGLAVLEVSMLEPGGVEAVKRQMLEKLGGAIDFSARPHASISERHRHLLLEADGELAMAGQMLEGKREDQVVLAAAHLRKALEKIGTATGRVYQEELLTSIFSRFCIGK